MFVPELERSWSRFVDDRPISSVTTQFLGYCIRKFAAAGKDALLFIWDNISWHKSHQVRDWITDHNREVKDTGCGVRGVDSALSAPTKSPWLNLIEPTRWVHSKCKVVEPERLLGAYELAYRVCGVFDCVHEPHVSIPQEIA